MRHFAAYETANALGVPVILTLKNTEVIVMPQSTARELSEEDYERSFGMPTYCAECGLELDHEDLCDHCYYCRTYGAAK